jgi:hypothetical protein
MQKQLLLLPPSSPLASLDGSAKTIRPTLA